jgi:Mg-chelatase subunit ChlD
VLAIDVSGSMQGTPLDQVTRSVDRLLDALRVEDRVGVVAFSAGAMRVVDPVAVDASGKKLVRARVARLFAEGQTNVEAGIALAAEALGPAEDGRRRGVIVLSDGEPTAHLENGHAQFAYPPTPETIRATIPCGRSSLANTLPPSIRRLALLRFPCTVWKK